MKKEELYKQIGKRIKSCRKEIGLTQEQLAELMDVTPQMISSAENGSKGIRPENIIKFSNALNISCDYILTGCTGITDLNHILEYSNNLDVNEIEQLIKLLQLLQKIAKKRGVT